MTVLRFLTSQYKVHRDRMETAAASPKNGLHHAVIVSARYVTNLADLRISACSSDPGEFG